MIDARFIQPFDFETFYICAENHDQILFVEESIFDGFSSLVTEKLLEDGKQALLNKVQFINASKFSPSHTSRNMQLAISKMSASDIASYL